MRKHLWKSLWFWGIILILLITITVGVVPTWAAQHAATNTASITISGDQTTTTLPTIPSDFIGLSYEASTLSTSAFTTTNGGNLIQLFKDLGTGNIRIGGNTVDRQVYWQDSTSQTSSTPSWATNIIGPNDLKNLAGLTNATQWQVELAVNLARTHTASQTSATPQALASITDEAQSAAKILGKQLKAIECGNEPNDYGHSSNNYRPSSYDYNDYQKDFVACANAIGNTAAIAGPDTTGTYIAQFITNEENKISMVTQHAYTISKCSGKTASASQLLSAQSDTNQLNKVSKILKEADTYHLPVRLDETNSVNCGGQAGVSNTYASSLWAVDYMLEMAQAGIAGVNLHGSLSLCGNVTGNGAGGGYTPLCATSPANQNKHIYTPQALFYGMLFFSQIGGGTFLPTTITTSNNLRAYALQGTDNKTRIVLIDKEKPSDNTINVTLHPGNTTNSSSSTGTASMISLTGKSLSSTQGISIQGATVQTNGTFTPGTADQIQENTDGSYTIPLKMGSAAIITLA